MYIVLYHLTYLPTYAYLEVNGVQVEEDENLSHTWEIRQRDWRYYIARWRRDILQSLQWPETSSTKNIVVQFRHRDKRISLLENTRRMRLTAIDTGFKKQASVFANERLCPELKKQPWQAASRKREYEWKLVWFWNEEILGRKVEDALIVKTGSGKSM